MSLKPFTQSTSTLQTSTTPVTNSQVVSSSVAVTNSASCATICIVSPRNGAVVHPGQTIEIEVAVGAGSSWQVGLVGPEPIGLTETKSSPPYNFSITIPATIAKAGIISVAAFGQPSSGEPVFSSPINIDIERSDHPVSVAPSLSELGSMQVGDIFPLDPTAQFADGSSISVGQSTQVTYSSTDPSVASVNASGTVEALAPGSTTISIQYGTVSDHVSVTVVGGTMRGDFNGDGQVTSDDLNIMLAAMGVQTTDDTQAVIMTKSVPATGPSDPRDLNHDGVIDYKDVQIEEGLIGSLADLAVAVQNAVTSSVVGTPMTFTAQLVNNGPDSASGVDLGIVATAVDANLNDVVAPTLMSVSNQSVCANDDTGSSKVLEIECKFSTLPNGATENITVTIRPTISENMTMDFRIYATTADPKGWNNESKFSIQVH
ncbi:MAG: Ig-like domain-containing protein [Minisyncoccia bacterium]